MQFGIFPLQSPDKRPDFSHLHEELNKVHGTREYED